MLIRWAAEDDLPQWFVLATEVSPIFQHPDDMGKDPEFITFAKSKVGKYEALTAVDYRSGEAMGFLGFSRKNNQISWFGVSERHRSKGAGERLLKTALRNLDHNKPISVVTFTEGFAPGIPARQLYRKYGFIESERITGPFDEPRCKMTLDLSGEKRGGSFHYHFPEFFKSSLEEHCPACKGEPAPEGQIDIILDHTTAVAEYPGQGRLFGKMYVMPKKHAFHFEDMPEEDMIGFMREVRRVGKTLRKITGAVKINYEMHANSGAHLHIHLFPRYLDDDFPSMPIDYRLTEPPYESYEEFLWFVEQLKKELR